MDLSIIISTRNRAQSLAKSLESITHLDVPFDRIEVIIGDNGSSDATPSVCQMYSKVFPNFTYTFDERPGQLVGWHCALPRAKADILAFIDDDIRLMPNWAKSVLESFETPEVGIATGRIIPEFEERPPSWQSDMVIKNDLGIWSALWGMLDFGVKVKEIPPDFVWGSNFLIRRKVFIEAGGFHPGGMPSELFHFTGDGDVGLSRIVAETGLKALYHPEAAVAHYLPAKRNSSVTEVRRWIFGEGLVTSYLLMRKLSKAYPEFAPIDLTDLVAETMSEAGIENIGRGYLTPESKIPDDLALLIKTSGAKGFNFHQEHFKNDSLFQEWVLRSNYLNIDSCYNHPDLQMI